MFGLWLLFVTLVATVHGATQEAGPDLGGLEDMEDLLLRDHQAKAYTEPDKKEGSKRNADFLLLQFNSARHSPKTRSKLRRYRRELRDDGGAISNTLSQDETVAHLAAIDDILATCPAPTSPEYRTIDGTCNNLGNPEQGAAESAVIRIIKNAYDDARSKPRAKTHKGNPLPSPREVCNAVFANKNNWRDGQPASTQVTSLAMHTGQLTDHDITAIHSHSVNCSGCSTDGECFSIPIKDQDKIFGGVQSCLTFRRSRHFTDSSGIRQHINSITAYLDGSIVYGSDDQTAEELKGDDGSMKHGTDPVTSRPLLPFDEDLGECAGIDKEANIYCSLAGDGRAAEQPGLTSLHTLFMREHNRVAAALHIVNPSLSAAEIYQRARKIVGAELQHIIYNEYLPLLVGEKLYKELKISPTASYTYDPETDASIANVFAAAAFRFGHTMIPDTLLRVTKNFRLNLPVIWTREAFFNASYLYDTSIRDGAVDSILRGMTVQNLPLVDRFMTSAIMDNLFGDPDVKGDGFDLASLNIQRGRDHGLPTYTTIRKELCGLGETPNFDYLTLHNIMSNENQEKLKIAYNGEVHDIDAFAGLILEKSLPNALVGPTLACVIANQFHRLKFGDRFFYQNPDQFTQAQMDEITKTSFARLMCDNVEAVTKIQPYLFVVSANYQGEDERGKRRFSSFYEYSRSGAWPHQRATILDGLDNSRFNCTLTEHIPAVDITVFA